MPKNDAVNYIIEAAAQVEEQKQKSSNLNGSGSDISVVYCIDISGSMNI